VSRAASPALTEARGPGSGGVVVFALRRGFLLFLLVAAAAQVPPLLVVLFGGDLTISTATKIGWFYALAFHRAAIEVAEVATAGPDAVLAYRLSVAALAGTGLALWLAYRAGEAVGERAGGAVERRALAGAAVAVGYAVPIGAITAVVRLDLVTEGMFFPDLIRIRGIVWEAFALPLALAGAAAAAGAAMGGIVPGSRAHAWLAGGWRMLLAALGLALAGVVILAAIRPAGLDAYARAVSANGPRVAALLLGNHALLVPNQSFVVLAPSMGGCTAVWGSEDHEPLLCSGRLSSVDPQIVLLDAAIIARGESVAESSRPLPFAYAVFLLVPLVATVLVGRSVAAGATRAGRGQRVALGAGAGVVFAVLVGVGTWMASITVRAVEVSAGGTRTGSVTLGARPLATGLLAIAWGMIGGAVGAAIPSPQEAAPVSGPEEEPPSPTSV
jgi:hypothetical protein